MKPVTGFALILILSGFCGTYGSIQGGRDQPADTGPEESGPAGILSAPPPGSARHHPLPPGRKLALEDLGPIQAAYHGNAPADSARPLSLASGQVDEDGVPDLLCGYTHSGGHWLTFHPGNIDAVFPHTPEARSRRVEGSPAPSPFHINARSVSIPTRPDYLVPGDFDNDGHLDVVVASLGGDALYLLGGDGHGGFRPAEAHRLPGPITALAGGDVNRPDALADLAVAVAGSTGPGLLVFEGPEGALRGDPETLSLPGHATEIVLGRLAGNYATDLVLAIGSEILILHGRDRQLTASRDRRESVAAPARESLSVDRPATGLAIGDFRWEDRPRNELAVLSDDGTVAVFGRAEPVPDGGEQPLREVFEHRWVSATEARGGSSARGRLLLTSRSAGWPTEDLILLDRVENRLHVISGLDPELSVSTALVDRPIAVLPMRLNADALSDLVVLQEIMGPGVLLTSIEATITVNSNADSATAGDGLCTLREAIQNSNTDSDTTAGDCVGGAGADSIEFAIGGGGSTATIAVTSALPFVTDSVTINGNTQGCASPPCIELDGSMAGAASGMFTTGGSSTFRGLVVNRFGDQGIRLQSPGNYVEGNFLGTDLTGTIAAGNVGNGVWALGSPNNTIGGTVAAARNVASDSATRSGVQVTGVGADGNKVRGNYLGTDVTGTVALGNFAQAIAVGVSAQNNEIGGVEPGAGNVLSGATEQSGFYLAPAGTNNLILGNIIGLDVTGTALLSNNQNGIVVEDAPDNTIGSSAAGGGNVISGNRWRGIFVVNTPSSGNKIQGNLIGTDVTGTIAMGNAVGSSYAALEIDDVTGTIIGGITPSARNVISGNNSNAVFLDDSTCSGNEVLGNFIGTDITGTLPLGNETVGVLASDGAHGNVIGGDEPGAGNVIADNYRGVECDYSATGNVVQGNHIGVDVTGSALLANSQQGVFIYECNGNTIGGGSPGAGNVISGNWDAVWIRGPVDPADNNVIQGNLMGTDASGTIGLGSIGAGVRIESADNNQVGGTAPGEGNVISANGQAGVHFMNGANRNRVLGNLIGTDITGTRALPNAESGVLLQSSSTATTVGGTGTGAGNLISGNGLHGIYVDSGSGRHTIQGNRIGTDISGTTLLGNALKGVFILDSSGSNVVGGTVAGAGNVIAGNGEEGLGITPDSIANSIQGNSIYDNGLLGIDLGLDGVTANDPQDPDPGANLLQNFPELVSASATAGSVSIEGNLNSLPSSSFRVEYFAGAACDASGHGEGERYLGHLDVTTDASGDASVDTVLASGVGDGEAVSATATSHGLAKNTSEFSACVVAVCSQTFPMAQTIVAQDEDTLTWGAAADVRFVKGDLAEVVAYGTSGGGFKLAASSLDMSFDHPDAGSGLYYLVRPLGCGSWQTSIGAEPDRDSALP